MKEMDRRQFLKNVFLMAGGGLAGLEALHRLGRYAVDDAMAHGILPSMAVMEGAAGYSDWNETDEEGWGDQANNVIWTMTGGLAANELGIGGGLAGANLILTDNGGIQGATGSPPSRKFTGNVYFSWTAAGAVAMLGGTGPWTIILKTHTVVDPGAWTYVFHFYDASTGDQLAGEVGVAGTVRFTMDAGGSATTVNAVPNAGDVYFVMEADGAGNLRSGFKATKPTTWTGWTAGDMVSAASNPAITEFDNRYLIAGDPTAGNYIDLYGYYLLISKKALLSG